MMAADPSAAACRPGFGYPLDDLHHRPCRRRSAGASLDFTLQGVLLARGGFPSGGPGPLDVVVNRLHIPGGREGNSDRLQGFSLAASSCNHRMSCDTRLSMPS